MNDNELDRLLDTWKSPAPPESMRQRLRGRFPRSERVRFARPLKWGLVTLLVSAALTFAVAQTGESHGDIIMRHLNHFYAGLVMMVDAHRAVLLTAEIRKSQPKVYVDGQLAGPPLGYGHGSSLRVQVPGGAVYAILFFDAEPVREGPPNSRSPWVKAGSLHDNLIEFEADSHQVRIECNSPLWTGGLPVYVMRQPQGGQSGK